jgi:hypothetical protein
MDRINDQASEINRLRQPTQSDALAPIGTEGKYVHDDLELSCRVTAHIEGWLEVEFLLDRSSAIIRPSRFIPLQEQSPFAQSIPSLHIHLQKTQINRPSNLHKTQIAKPERPDMTDTVSRQDVIDAVRSVPPGTTCRGDAIIAAINAIPAVTVTDEMCLNAGNAFHDALTAGLSAPEAMKVALVAALGE